MVNITHVDTLNHWSCVINHDAEIIFCRSQYFSDFPKGAIFDITLRSWIVVPTGINVPTGQMMEIQLTYLPE